MPSIEFHVRHSICRKDVAKAIHEWLDNPAGFWLGKKAHAMWRSKTHKPEVMAAIGAIIAWLHGEDPKKGMVDALRHYLHDELFISIFTEKEE